MGYNKNIFIETTEELQFIASKGDPQDIAAITAYLKGESGSTHGVISPTFEYNLDLDLTCFLEAWGRILADVESASEEGGEDWYPCNTPQGVV